MTIESLIREAYKGIVLDYVIIDPNGGMERTAFYNQPDPDKHWTDLIYIDGELKNISEL